MIIWRIEHNSVTLDNNQRWYSFNVTTPDTKINAHLELLPGNEAHDLVLWRLDGNWLIPVAFSENWPFHRLAQNVGYVVATPGTYFLLIDPIDVSISVTTTFGIFVQQNRLEINSPMIDQYEPNDNHVQAVRVPSRYITGIGMDNLHDEDWFVFEADGNYIYHNVMLINHIFNSSGIGNAIRLEVRPAFEVNGKIHSQPGFVSPLVTQGSPRFIMRNGFRLQAGELYAIRVMPLQWNANAIQGRYQLRISPNNGVTNFGELSEWLQVDTTVQNYSIHRITTNNYRLTLDFTQRGYNLVTGERYYIRIIDSRHTGTLAHVESFRQSWLNMAGFRRFGTNPHIRATFNWN